MLEQHLNDVHVVRTPVSSGAVFEVWLTHGCVGWLAIILTEVGKKVLCYLSVVYLLRAVHRAVQEVDILEELDLLLTLILNSMVLRLL